jgi:hypothetical protein
MALPDLRAILALSLGAGILGSGSSDEEAPCGALE